MAGLARAFAFLGGAALSLTIVLGAVRTIVVPRGEPVPLTRFIFATLRGVFAFRARRARDYEDRDRIMATYGPIGLVSLPFCWVALVIVGFTGVFWGLGVDPLRKAFTLSGSSVLTLGFAAPPDLPTQLAAFIEAMLGLGLVALLITYLPSIYAAFQRRELSVNQLATRAGDPPSAIVMIERHHALSRLDALDDLWDDFEVWFADVEETHTSQPSLVFFRSIDHRRSWVTAAGVVLDGASLWASTLDVPRDPRAELCIRSGYLALRRVAACFDLPYDADPAPDDPISIERVEFDDACDRLEAAGVPLRADRDTAWRDFAGWRVNYDQPLLGLAGLTMAPFAPWSSDRSLRYRRPSITRRRRRR